MADKEPRMIVTTAMGVDGFEVAEYLGVVRGIVVRAATITQGIRGAFSSFFGGNITAYEEVCERARSDAFKRMAQQAREIGADAIIGMAYDATEFAPNVTEVLAYGTAVTLRPKSA
ncbi:YbjQ family protein [Gemmata algarum]|uniref:YbjQ family protein n=1 Tax=Gemmata algarum TaxID=2975278 RepID=UPI0039C945A3